MKLERVKSTLTQNLLSDEGLSHRKLIECYSAPSRPDDLSKRARTLREGVGEKRIDCLLTPYDLGVLHRMFEFTGIEVVVCRYQGVYERFSYLSDVSTTEVDREENERWRLVFVARETATGGTLIADWHGHGLSYDPRSDLTKDLIDCASRWNDGTELESSQPNIIALSHQVSGALIHEIVGHAVESDNVRLNELNLSVELPDWLHVAHDPLADAAWVRLSRDDAGQLMARTLLVDSGRFTGSLLGLSYGDGSDYVVPSLRGSISSSNLSPRFYHLDVMAEDSPSPVPDEEVEQFNYLSIDRFTGQIRL